MDRSTKLAVGKRAENEKQGDDGRLYLLTMRLDESAAIPSATQHRGGMFIAVAFTTTIFVSASLLFFVQPIYAKLVLPLLGGAPAVWTTAMLFFQSVLLAGYAYSHAVSTCLPARRQLVPHLVVWACGLAFLPIAIPAGWTYDVTASPIGQTLMIFAMGVGLPFFALAANAPLLQKWYASSGGPAAGDP